MTDNNIFQPAPIENHLSPNIKVIGVGGAGGNAVSHMIRKGLKNVEFIAVNTDSKALGNCLSPYRIQLGEKGTGAGTKPEVGRDLALQSRDALTDVVRGADMLFIAAGMGGGTGTGVAPVIAQIARELDILTVAVVTKPFTTEGPLKARSAVEGIEQLEKLVNALIVVHNDKLKKELPPNVKMKEALAAADNVLYNAVSGVSDIIYQVGHMQVDFADVCTVMEQAGVSMMGSAVASGENRAITAIESALRSPFLEEIEIKQAMGVLVNIAASEESLGLDEFDMVMTKIRECASDDAIIKSGMAYDESLGDQMKVTVLVTGLNRPKSMGIRPAPRHSHSLQREDARGNPIAPVALPQNLFAGTPSHSKASPTFAGETLAPMMSTSSPENEPTQSTESLMRAGVSGVFRKNPTRTQSVAMEPRTQETRPQASEADRPVPAHLKSTSNPLGGLIGGDTTQISGRVSGQDNTSATSTTLGNIAIPNFLKRKVG